MSVGVLGAKDRRQMVASSLGAVAQHLGILEIQISYCLSKIRKEGEREGGRREGREEGGTGGIQLADIQPHWLLGSL